MIQKFEDFNFKVINIIRKGESEMQINKKYITFTKRLIDEMGYPAYVQIMFDSVNKIFALQSCKESDEKAYRFSKPKGEQKEPRYCVQATVKKLIIAALDDRWSEDSFFGVKGTYFKEAKAMVFDLKTAYVRSVK